jgi:pimeloyl-ACP methyl ester carboxylesterase
MADASVTAEELHSALAAFRAEARHGTLDTERYRMRYFAWGSGPPVVFIHGMADTAGAFAMVMHRLASRFTCIAYELADGTTDGSRLARYTPADYTADLLALLDHIGITRAAVVGSSFGSTIAIHSLAAAPDRFTHGVLQNGFAHRPLNRWQRQLARSARFWPGWFGDWPEIHSRVMRWRVDRTTLSALPPAVADFFLKEGCRTPIRASALRTLAIDRTDLRSLLPGIRAPVLLITSDRDQLVPRSCWDEIAARLPGVQRVEFTECGHYTHYTHPGAMAEAIERFLRESPPTVGGGSG